MERRMMLRELYGGGYWASKWHQRGCWGKTVVQPLLGATEQFHCSHCSQLGRPLSSDTLEHQIQSIWPISMTSPIFYKLFLLEMECLPVLIQAFLRDIAVLVSDHRNKVMESLAFRFFFFFYTTPVNCNKGKCNKIRYACTWKSVPLS